MIMENLWVASWQTVFIDQYAETIRKEAQVQARMRRDVRWNGTAIDAEATPR